jgi:outer membrane protein OmpA-like peptidoglycan-associated protein
MSLRYAALTCLTLLLAACQSNPSDNGAWMMQGDVPWVGADGQCMQLRPLKTEEKQGFCYDVMTGVYQKKHHYEVLQPDEFAFLYNKAEPTPPSMYAIEQPAPLGTVAPAGQNLAYVQQLYTALPFRINNAHLSSHNRDALHTAFNTWKSQGISIETVDVTGHTDPSGPQNYNFLLSRWRAESVAYYLKRMGVPQKAISEAGVAMLGPHPQAHTPEDNRYVDLRVWLLPPPDAPDTVAVAIR